MEEEKDVNATTNHNATSHQPMIMFSTALSGSVFSAAFLVGVDPSSSQQSTTTSCQPVIDGAVLGEVCLRGRPEGGRAAFIISDALVPITNRAHRIKWKCIDGCARANCHDIAD